MSDEATLFLLKDKLDRVRKARRNNIIGVFVAVIVIGLFWNNYFYFDFTVGLFLAIGLGTLAVWLINRYYTKQEIAILRQIENMSRGNVY